jgi:hypothetical protein
MLAGFAVAVSNVFWFLGLKHVRLKEYTVEKEEIQYKSGDA